MRSYDVIVVGAGIAGLVTGLRAAREGRATLVLEAADEAGGCVRSHRVAGIRLDRGAESFATTRPAVGDLARDLALPTEPPAAGAAWIFHRAGPAPIPEATLLGIPAHPSAADVRRVIGRAGVARALLDRVLPAHPRSGRTPGLGELVARRMGTRVLERLVAPIVTSVYSAEPAGLDIDAVAPGLLSALQEAGSLTAAVGRTRGGGPAAGSAVAAVTGGMGRLTEALVAALTRAAGTLRCGTPVRSITRAGDRWLVCYEDAAAAERGAGDGQGTSTTTVAADCVVVAVPGPAAAPLVADATNGSAVLPVPASSDVELVTLVVDAPELDAAPRGTGVLVAPDVPGVSAKALTHASAKWAYVARAAGPGRHVLRLSYGTGKAAPSPDAFPRLALDDASRILGVPLDRVHLVDHAVVRYSGRLAARRAAHRDALAEFDHQLASIPGLRVCGSAVAGTGLGAVVTNATGVSFARHALERQD